MQIKIATTGLVWAHRLTDVILPLFIMLSLITFAPAVELQERYLVMGILGGLIFAVSAQLVGLYQQWLGYSLFTGVHLILKAWGLTWMFLIVIAFLIKDSSNFSRIVVTSWAILTPAILIGYRVGLRTLLAKYRSTTKYKRRIAIIGAGKVGQELALSIEQNKWLGYEVVAFYDDNPNLINQKINKTSVLGNCDTVYNDAQKELFEEIYICLPLHAELKIKYLLNLLADTALTVKFIPDLFSFDLLHAKWTEIQGIPIISIYDSPLKSTTNRILKRGEDIILASVILILISPVLAWIAYKIKSSSPGPVIFKQTRYGINGKEIKVYKFRSMTSQDNGAIVKQATKDDSRITPFGSFIRKTSLDELPQFVNVLQGKMSIVGPRPHAVAHNEEYRQLIPKYMQRHIVKPGITGWAQINGWRGETDTLDKMEKRVEYDLHYIKNWSLWLDIKIVFLTIFKGFINKNAY